MTKPMLARSIENDPADLLGNREWALELKCLTGGSRVLTRRGLTKIRNVSVEDEILAADGGWHAISAISKRERGRDRIVEIKPHCSLRFKATEDHLILTERGWKPAGAIAPDDWVALPRPRLSTLPFDPALRLSAASGYEKAIKIDSDFAWLCGYFVGDGYASIGGSKMHGRIWFACADTKPEVVDRIESFAHHIGVTPRRSRPAGVSMTSVYFVDLPLAEWLNRSFRIRKLDNHIKDTAHSKTLPPFLDTWPDDLFDAFLDGYWEADGCEGRQSRATTVSPHLAGLLWRQTLARGNPLALGEHATSWTHQEQKRTAATFTLERIRSARHIRSTADGYLVRVQQVRRALNVARTQTVYDLTVPTAGNFLSGCIVHNCNGKRLFVEPHGRQVKGYSRKGDRTDIPQSVARELTTIVALGAALDGELMDDGTFQVFDMPWCGDLCTPDSRWADRRETLEALFSPRVWTPHYVRLVPSTTSTRRKRNLAAKIFERGYEGYVLKHTGSMYVFGPRRSHRWLKVKNVRSVDCIVAALGVDKQNLALELVDLAGERVPIGECSRLEGDAPKAKVGDVIEVEILSAGKPEAPRLYQPHAKALRTDKGPEECSVEQLEGCWTKRKVLL